MTVHFHRPARPVFGVPEWLGAIGVPLLLVARFVPLARLPGWGCLLRLSTGIPCPTCGMTRSFDWFAQGRLGDSLHINPLGGLLAASVAFGFVYLLAYPLRPPRLAVELSPKASLGLRIAVVIALAVNWAYLVVHSLRVQT